MVHVRQSTAVRRSNVSVKMASLENIATKVDNTNRGITDFEV